MDIISLAQAMAYITLYAITGFGPGFILGTIIGNSIGAKGKESISDKYIQNIKSAATHNAQWHPTHKRWRDDTDSKT